MNSDVVCWFFFMLSHNFPRRIAEWGRQQAGRWIGGERATDRKIDMIEWQTGRAWDSRGDKWENQNGVYSSSMSELVCKMKQQNISQFPRCWHTQTNSQHEALKSALCMKHGVTHVAWVISRASVAGTQMAMDTLNTAWTRGRCGLWWRFADRTTPSVNTWQPVFNFLLSCRNCGWRHMGAVYRTTVIAWRMDICVMCMNRSGLGTYCGSNISETNGSATTVKPCILDKALSDFRRKLSAKMPKP